MKKNVLYSIIVIALLFFPTINFGQVFSLGTVANFVLYTSNGAVSNTGSSTLTGNIGSDIGAISGFGSATVIGSFYNADVVTAQAKTDLANAYNQLISRPVTNAIHAPAFGSGETLTKGVYALAGAGSLAGTLTLDGLGDTTSVFIFRFGGAYAIGAGSSVILTNGARPCNICWIAEGAISIGAASIMKGTFIANNAAISMAADGNLEGRLLSTTGAVAFGPSVAYIQNCFNNIMISNPPPCCHTNFGATIDFVLFTNNGAVSNSGASTFTGNIGSDMGVISGFGTATVTGAFYNADAITAQAKIDLNGLYNQLSLAPTTNTSHTPSFGGGETLYAGVYYIGGAGSLGGTLTLDAQGDINAVFIFKISGAFAVGASSTIILLNSASACNVFWVVEGAISIGASSIMKGTFIANNGAVSMAASGDLKGRLFSTTGAIAFDQSNASNFAPVPIIHNVTGGGSFCSVPNDGVPVGISNSELGTTYQLFNNLASVGSAISGTGSPITFGNQNVAGNYTVVATKSSSSCTSNMNGFATVVRNLASTWYIDADADGYGNPAIYVLECYQPSGYISDNTDCNDASPSINPGAIEICGNGIDDNCDGNIDEGCGIKLSIHLNIQGFYRGGGSNIGVIDPLNCDTVVMKIASANPPFVVQFTSIKVMSLSGFLNVIVPSSFMNGYYYLVIDHRNSLQIWSANPVYFNQPTINYDFTSLSSSAYGNNLGLNQDGSYSILSGDVNKNGVIDFNDYILIENAAINFTTGYSLMDLTGDHLIESSDYSLVENNFGRIILKP